jgi:hypothetical protein
VGILKVIATKSLATAMRDFLLRFPTTKNPYRCRGEEYAKKL